ncbi:unnamed protein product [Orchesella dallaii]|uniref:Uncharacterized protein n=1 Tax=Orchesella dallaii TaxID=48710 RepID=A0ABP1PSG7_9HEXA
MLTNISNNNLPSRRRRSAGGSSYSTPPATNFHFNSITPPGNLFGIHSFQNQTAAHTFINATLNGGNYTGTVAAATTMEPGAIRRNIDSMRSYTTSGTSTGRIQSGFPFSCLGDPVSIHPIFPSSSPQRRRRRQSPCPASALFLVCEVQDLPGHRRSPFHSGRYFGSPSSLGFGSQSSQSSTSSLDSNHSYSSSCNCDECRQCICFLYCDEHAYRYCPLHGLGEPDTTGECQFPNASSGMDCRLSTSPHGQDSS